MSSRLRRKRRLHPGTWKVVALRVGLLVLAGSLALVALAAVAGFSYVNMALKGLPDVNDTKAFRLAQPTKVYAADGTLLANFYLQNREVVPISAISSDLANAVVAVEDERFYEHNGVDVPGIIRAQIINTMAGGVEEGASTITQQYIRNTILSAEATQVSYTRKLREATLAMDLEKLKSKREILELYLNAVYFGDGAYGAEAASKHFFNKHANDLTLAEASLLAGLPQSPNGLNPFTNLKGAKDRQRVVLERMVGNSKLTHVTKAMADAAYAEPLNLQRTVDPEQGIYASPYFVSYVRKVLLSQYPDSLVFQGGLKVYTTLDPKLDAYAIGAVRSVLNRPKDPQAALVAIDPRNGYIRAMYGGNDYMGGSRYNYATQGHRQPGSSFKMFVLVTALEEGMPPKRMVDASSPAVIKKKGNKPWKVSNSEGSGKGAMTITAATAGSVNVVFARLIAEIGAQKVATTAKRMGIQSPIPPYLSIALGSAPVSPLDMASAYGVLANGGVRNPPTAITKIVDPDGNTIYEHKPAAIKVLTPEISWAATQQLLGVVRSGTAKRAQIKGREIAGKTGTAQNYQDAWFCGYTPQLSVAVWMGYAKGSIPMRNVHGQRAFGGTFCAPIWRNFMVKALAGQPALKFARAKDPHYTWKAEWAKPVIEKPPTPAAPPVTPPPTPPPSPDPSSTPTP